MLPLNPPPPLLLNPLLGSPLSIPFRASSYLNHPYWYQIFPPDHHLTHFLTSLHTYLVISKESRGLCPGHWSKLHVYRFQVLLSCLQSCFSAAYKATSLLLTKLLLCCLQSCFSATYKATSQLLTKLLLCCLHSCFSAAYKAASQVLTKRFQLLTKLLPSCLQSCL